MSSILFKDLSVGSTIYALVKDSNDLKYLEGSVVSIGQQRIDFALQQTKTVIDLTYSLEDKNYTDVIDITSYVFSTEKIGNITLISTDKELIIRELQATLKKAEDFIKSLDVEVPKNKKRIEDCKKLISSLDTTYAEKQKFEERIKKLEDNSAETNKLLNELLSKFK